MESVSCQMGDAEASLAVQGGRQPDEPLDIGCHRLVSLSFQDFEQQDQFGYIYRLTVDIDAIQGVLDTFALQLVETLRDLAQWLDDKVLRTIERE